MKVLNTSKRLICIHLGGKDGRIDILPGVVTDCPQLDAVKGKNKVVDHYFTEEILKEVKGDKKSPKELLQDEARSLGIEVTDEMTKADLEKAIAEAKDGQ